MDEQSVVRASPLRWMKTHRNVIAFWFLGLANNYGYVVMLSAAHDILASFENPDAPKPNYRRQCNSMSTGIILLADIMPSIIVKIVSPFLPLYIKPRMAITISLSIAGFVLVAGSQQWLVLLGVVCISLSCGLGESSLLSYLVFFSSTDVLSTWSSGTGGAGVIGSMSYAALTSLGLSTGLTILVMLCVPALQAACFFLFLKHPRIDKRQGDMELVDKNMPSQADLLTVRERLNTLPRLLLHYMLPFGMVYLFEYSINQGLFELLYFPSTFLTHSEQYRWYSVLYQVGVFVSRSSMGLVRFDNIWLLAFLQFVNITLCLAEVLFGYMTYLPVLMVMVLWEGLVGGASYVNTYRRIATEMPPETRQFSMAMNSFADVIMITCAGIVAYPTHSIICSNYPSPYQNS